MEGTETHLVVADTADTQEQSVAARSFAPTSQSVAPTTQSLTPTTQSVTPNIFGGIGSLFFNATPHAGTPASTTNP